MKIFFAGSIRSGRNLLSVCEAHGKMAVIPIFLRTSPLLPPSTDGAPPLRGATHAAHGSG